jgi:chromosome segregation ATPase
LYRKYKLIINYTDVKPDEWEISWFISILYQTSYVKYISLLFSFFVIALSVQAQTGTGESVKDSLKAELKELESYEEKFNLRIELLKKSNSSLDSMIPMLNNKIRVLDSFLLSKKKLLEEYENIPDKSANVKKAISKLTKDCADLGEHINHNRETLESIYKDHLETKEILAEAERRVTGFRKRIIEIRKELQL